MYCNIASSTNTCAHLRGYGLCSPAGRTVTYLSDGWVADVSIGPM